MMGSGSCSAIGTRHHRHQQRFLRVENATTKASNSEQLARYHYQESLGDIIIIASNEFPVGERVNFDPFDHHCHVYPSLVVLRPVHIDDE